MLWRVTRQAKHFQLRVGPKQAKGSAIAPRYGTRTPAAVAVLPVLPVTSYELGESLWQEY